MITVFLTASYWYMYFTKDHIYLQCIHQLVKNVSCLPVQEKLGKLLFFKLRCTDWCAAKKMTKAYSIHYIMNYKQPHLFLKYSRPRYCFNTRGITFKCCFIADYTTVNIQTLILHFAYNDQCSVGYCSHEMSKCFVTFSNIGKVKGNITTPSST